jgi:hypothetical protein
MNWILTNNKKHPGGRTKLVDSLDDSSYGGRLDKFLVVG